MRSEHAGVARGHPADAQSRQAVGLGHHPQAHRVLIEIAGGGQGVGGIMLQLPVHFVGEQQQPRLPADLDQPRLLARRHQIAGRVVRQVDDHSPRLGRDQLRQLVQIGRPAMLFPPQPGHDIAADAAGDLRQRLIVRRLHDHGIAGLQRGLHEVGDRLHRAGMDQHLLRSDPAIQPRDLRPQRGRPRRFRIAEPLMQELVGRVRLQRQQLADGQRLAVRTRDQVGRGELVFCEVAFDLER